MDGIETGLSGLIAALEAVLFFPVGGVPLIVLWSIVGTVVLTLRMRFLGLRGLGEAIALLRTHNATPSGVSSFQAFTTALSSTIGLGNIAGVAIAISVGGPGACFWMTIAGIFTMNTRLIESTLGRKYRQTNPDGSVSGGPMYYLTHGLAAQGKARWGKILAAIFALCCVLGALGSSGMFQSGQSYRTLVHVMPDLSAWGYGVGLAIAVALVTVGGLHRVGQVTSWLVPIMCALYVITAVYILGLHWQAIPAALQTIWHEAWHPRAGLGGVVGLMALGFRRAAFSNEGNIGTASIAHAATEGTTPIQEGLIASLEPVIDTVLICNLTALVIIVTGTYQDPQYADFAGAELTSAAFGSAIAWFPWLLAAATFFFAFSTIISWGYYGEAAWVYLFGSKRRPLYQGIQLSLIIAGTLLRPELVVQVSDISLLLMTVPNLLGLYSLSREVRDDLVLHFSPGTFSPDFAAAARRQEAAMVRSGQDSNL
ncbi:alanine/glycine:cation symporter family protein [Spirulina major]|uniref:alanine/glycine:cation symporter family protein n=1 Tax=Spirulina major TaxID=270636 RepID=UPI0009321309|nr:amino acid carrier protein [Spirulina major]